MAAAGTVTPTVAPEQVPIKRVELAWTSDGSGDVSVALADGQLNGILKRVETVPSAVSATKPSDNYDLSLVDADAYDVLQGLGADRDDTNVEVVVPLLAHVVAASTDAYVQVALAGIYTLTIAHAGALKAGKVILFLGR